MTYEQKKQAWEFLASITARVPATRTEHNQILQALNVLEPVEDQKKEGKNENIEEVPGGATDP